MLKLPLSERLQILEFLILLVKEGRETEFQDYFSILVFVFLFSFFLKLLNFIFSFVTTSTLHIISVELNQDHK